MIRYYGIILMLGVLAGAYVASLEARRRGEDPEIVWDGLVWVLVGGVIGARIWHIFTPPPSMVARGITTQYYLTHPLDALAIWNGGLGIAGAVIGGLIAIYFYGRRYKLELLSWVDIAAPGLALGQAIGRWGNFVNQELYGQPTDLPWAIYIDPQFRLPGYEAFEYFHPTFLYESLWSLGNMGLLLYLSRRYGERLKPGDIFLTYLVIYPLGRFLIEFLRLDSSQVAGLNANQVFVLLIALVAAGLLVWRHRFQSAPAEAPSEPGDESPEMVEPIFVEHIEEDAEGEQSPEGDAAS
jgi:phosphatidylglycerol:prolipoprotein diacylglycerol transferase